MRSLDPSSWPTGGDRGSSSLFQHIWEYRSLNVRVSTLRISDTLCHELPPPNLDEETPHTCSPRQVPKRSLPSSLQLFDGFDGASTAVNFDALQLHTSTEADEDLSQAVRRILGW